MKVTKQETCIFIRDTVAQLSKLATDMGFDVLSYTLCIAQLEADNQLAEMQKPPTRKAAAYGPIRDSNAPRESFGATAP